MQRTMHNLITLWKYLHREDYLQQLRNEYEDLKSTATRASTLDEHDRLNRQRATVAAEIRSLAQPLRLRMRSNRSGCSEEFFTRGIVPWRVL